MRISMRKSIAYVAAAAALCGAAPAAATVTVDFSATNFSALNGGIPLSSATGSLSYDYNPNSLIFTLTAFSIDIGAKHYGLTDIVTSLAGNGPAGGLTGQVYGTGWSFTFGAEAAGDLYEIGASDEDFIYSFFMNPQTGSQLGGNIFMYSNGTHYFNASNVAVTSAVTNAVPEPGTWAMMLLGFAAIGAQLRRKGRRRAALA